jgi:hypothetical protein
MREAISKSIASATTNRTPPSSMDVESTDEMGKAKVNAKPADSVVRYYGSLEKTAEELKRSGATKTNTAGTSKLNLHATAARQAIYVARSFDREDWQATPAASGLDLAALTEDYRYRFSDASLTPHAAALGNTVTSRTGSTLSSAARDEHRADLNELKAVEDEVDLSKLVLTEQLSATQDDKNSDQSYQPSQSEPDLSYSELEQGPEIDMGTERKRTPAVEDNTQLTYRISPEDLRRALLASRNSNAAFWTYKLYKNAAGQTPRVHYCTTYEQTESQAKHFLDTPVVGFDLEWEFGASPAKRSAKDCVSLVQIASEDRIGLFQLALFKGETPEELIPPSLRTILESRDITKVGVNVVGDANRVEKCFGIKMQGCFELSHLHKVVKYSASSPDQVNRRLTKLADQVHEHLLLPLKKDDVRTSAWSKKLRFDQTEYAASDAYSGFQLYHALEAKRKKMAPMPPRPAFLEDKQPLILDDGTKLAPATVTRKAISVATRVTEEDEDDEFFDAMEVLDDNSIESMQTAGVPLSGLSVVYPTLPQLDYPSIAKGTVTSGDKSDVQVASSSAERAKKVNKRQPPPPSNEVALAEQWAASWRASLPSGYNLKVGHSTLRAYHLWHEQGFNCSEVASLLRDPPLSVSTVASYVLEALKQEGLSYNTERVKIVFEILPKSVHNRYQKILSKINA